MKKIIIRKKRDSHSVTQQVNAVGRAEIIDKLMAGAPVPEVGNFQQSYDFPDGEVDFSAERLELKGDKIDQYLQTKEYGMRINDARLKMVEEKKQAEIKKQVEQQLKQNGTDTGTKGEASNS